MSGAPKIQAAQMKAVQMPGSKMRTARLRPRGLPKRLPEGERLLWQGSPAARTLTRRAFHIGWLAAYFALMLAWSVGTAVQAGVTGHSLAVCVLHRLALALIPLALIALYAWSIERSTIYSITTKRVVISFGLALPMSFNIPFTKIVGAGLRLYPDGAGDIPLQLHEDEKMSYLVLWPHARPWHTAKTQPMLRCVANAAEASAILGEALSAETGLADGAKSPHTVNQSGRSSWPVPSAGLRPTQAA